MNSRTLPFLLLLLLGLGGVYLLTRGERDSPAPAGPLAVEPFLVALDGVEPTRIEVKNFVDEQKRYAFDLGSIPWRMTVPNEDEAAPAHLRSFLRQIDGMERRLFAAADKITDKMLKESGLDAPRGKYILGTDDREIEVWIGDEGYALMDAAGGQPLQTLFVRMDGALYLVPKGFDQLMETNPEELRNKILFVSGPNDIRSLRVVRLDDEGEKAEVRIQKRKNGRYYLELPYQTPINRQVFANWLGGLLSVRIQEFLPVEKSDAAALGPKLQYKPWLTIEMENSSFKEHVEIIRGPDGRVFAKKKGRPSLMLVDDRTFRVLATTPPQTLISTALWAWSPIEAWKIQVEVSSLASETKRGQILVLENQRPQAGFKMISPRVVASDARRNNELFAALETCKILGLAEGAEALEAQRLLAQPDVEVKLTPIPGNRRSTFSVKIAKGSAGRFFGTTTESDLVFRLDCPGFDKLGKAWWRYVQPVAFRYPPGRPILHIRLSRPDKKPVLARFDAKGWLLDGKPSEDMDEVFDTLRKLVAREILGEVKLGEAARRLASAQTLGTLEFYQGPPEKEEGPVATLRLSEEEAGVLAVNGNDGLLYRLRAPDARDLKKILEW